MARWLRTVESNCRDPEREAEYINWYKTVHIPDVLGFKPGGMLTGDLYERQDVQPGEGKYMAIYEIEAEDIAQSEAARMANLPLLIEKGRMSDLMEVVSRHNFRKI